MFSSCDITTPFPAPRAAKNPHFLMIVKNFLEEGAPQILACIYFGFRIHRFVSAIPRLPRQEGSAQL